MTLDQKIAYCRILTARMEKYYPTRFEMLFCQKRFKRKERIYQLLAERRAHVYKLAVSEAYNLGRQAAREEAKAEFIANAKAAGWQLSNPEDIDKFFPKIF